MISTSVAPVVVSTNPLTSVNVIDVEPLNTFSIMCTAVLPDGTAAPKSFRWERLLQGTSVSENLTDNGDNVIIVDENLSSPTSTSILTVRENTAGNYTYTCTATLQTLPGDPIISGASSVDVVVRGTSEFASVLAVNAAVLFTGLVLYIVLCSLGCVQENECRM